MSNRRRPTSSRSMSADTLAGVRAGIDAALEAVAEVTDRDPVYFLNYPGDVRATFADDRPLGPSLSGDLLWPVQVSYNEDLDLTRVGLTRIAPERAA